MKEPILAISLMLCGCAKNLENNPILMACPLAPVYPTLSDSELSCVSDETYEKIVDSIQMRKEMIIQLEAYCEQ